MLAAAFAVSIAAHELGHALAARSLGYRPRPFLRFPWAIGVRIETAGGELPALHDLAIAAAGPLVSLWLAEDAARAGLLELAIASGTLGLVNLLPFRGSDGARLLAALDALYRPATLRHSQAMYSPETARGALPGASLNPDAMRPRRGSVRT